MQSYFLLHSPTLKIEPTIWNDVNQALRHADNLSIENAGHVVHVMAAVSTHHQEIRAARMMIDISDIFEPAGNVRQLQAAE